VTSNGERVTSADDVLGRIVNNPGSVFLLGGGQVVHVDPGQAFVGVGELLLGELGRVLVLVGPIHNVPILQDCDPVCELAFGGQNGMSDSLFHSGASSDGLRGEVG
jgi:hypothetical protein